jgi:hypothetical protein
MDVAVFPLRELPVVLGTLRAVSSTSSAAQDRFVELIGRIHGVAVDCAVPEVSFEHVASVITDPHRRKRLLQLAIVSTTVDGVVDAHEAKVIARLAAALGVEEPATRTMRQLAAHQDLSTRIDLTRRLLGKYAGEAWREEGFNGLRKLVAPMLFDGGESPKTAWRYKQLGLLPQGSFGRALWEHFTTHQFSFPGERGGIPERMMFHDLGHVLSGYGTNPEGEIQQAAFQSGFVRDDGFGFLFFGIVQFHLGVKVTPIAEAESGYFDADRLVTALERGAACKLDLSDHWDFWPYLPRPLEAVRDELGIPPAARSGGSQRVA